MDKDTLLLEFSYILEKHDPSYDIIMDVCMAMMIKMFYDSELKQDHREAIYETIEATLQKLKDENGPR